MGVSLYTVRVVLKILGVEDYGIYTVVGGLVTMLSFLSGTMGTASQRFLAFELGQKNYERLKKTFSITVIIYILIAGVILLLAETVGLWFLNNKMIIPIERKDTANFVYQFSILTFMITMFSIPYNAAIIAHERMNVYAYVSIIEVSLKLLVVYLLDVFYYDKLKLYAVLLFINSTIITYIYISYCRSRFKECRFSFYWDKELFRKIVSFSGWNLFGALASVSSNQGVGIVLNIFFLPVVNAAQSLAYQVNGAINLVVANFVSAVNPQITKYYATGERNKVVDLVFKGSKLSYFLLLFLSVPILLETNFVLSTWLGDIPVYTVIFTRLLVIVALIDSLSGTIVGAALATGKIKKYQIIVGGIRLFNLPILFILLQFGFPPPTAMYIAIPISVVSLFYRIRFLREMIGFSLKNFIKEVIIKVILCTLFTYIIPLLIIYKMDYGLLRFVLVLILGLLSAFFSVYFVGLTENERIFIRNFFSRFEVDSELEN